MLMIKRGIPINGHTYVPGEEAALAAVLAPHQVEYLKSRGALEDTAAPSTALFQKPSPSVTDDDAFETVASIVSDELGIERNDEETGREFIFWLANEQESLHNQLEQQEADHKAKVRELVEEKEFLKEQLTAWTSPESPREQLIVALRDLGAEFIQVLLSAGFDSKEKVSAATDDELIALPKLGKARVAKIRELLKG